MSTLAPVDPLAPFVAPYPLRTPLTTITAASPAPQMETA